MFGGKNALDVTNFIAYKSNKELLDGIIAFPVRQIAPINAFAVTGKVNMPLVGNAVEHLADINYYLANKDLLLNPTIRWEHCFSNFLIELYNHQGKVDMNDSYVHYLDPKYKIFPNVLGGGKSWEGHYRSLNVTGATSGKKLSDFISCFKSYVKTINAFRFDYNFYRAVIGISQLLPDLEKYMNVNYWFDRTNEDDVKALELIGNKMTRDLLVGDILFRQPYLNFEGLQGRPDFICDETLIEIKTTKDFLPKTHIRQVVAYYLIHKLSKSKDFTIRNIKLFYAQHLTEVELDPHRLIDKRVIKKIQPQISDAIKVAFEDQFGK